MNNIFKLISSIKIFFQRRIVLISIENFNREFAGKEILSKYLDQFKKDTKEEIFKQRKEKFLNIGKQKAFTCFIILLSF